MRGDILIIGEHHRQAARGIFKLIKEKRKEREGRYIITIAGESGAGKSELAAALKEVFDSEGINSFIFQQDDYFIFPPRTNAGLRVDSIDHVGMSEVRLDLLNDTIRLIRQGRNEITKPLVFFDEDEIGEEVADLKGFDAFIFEGTYVTSLSDVNCRIFIDRDLDDTRADRMRRNREKQDPYLEKILQIEHKIISGHKKDADIVVDKEFNVHPARSTS